MKTIDAKTVQEKLENGEQLNLIDVREAEEVAAGKSLARYTCHLV